MHIRVEHSLENEPLSDSEIVAKKTLAATGRELRTVFFSRAIIDCLSLVTLITLITWRALLTGVSAYVLLPYLACRSVAMGECMLQLTELIGHVKNLILRTLYKRVVRGGCIPNLISC